MRKVRARVSEEPTGFVWVEDRSLAGTGYPASRGQLQWLASQGIKAVLTLTEMPLPSQWLEGLGLSAGHVPMGDHQLPDVASLEDAAAFIGENLREGRATAVHCLAGEGRTGCALAAYLIRSRGMGPEEAIATLRRAKPQFVERGQEAAVREFALATKGRAPGPA